MKLGITEKQLKLILSTEEVLDEEETAPPVELSPDAPPKPGTSDKQSGGQGYPDVGKWESGVTRGPANQVGVTKWSEIVGASLKRGHANPLKEQKSDFEMDRQSNALLQSTGIRSNKDAQTVSGAIKAGQEHINLSWSNQFYLGVGSLAAGLFVPGMQGVLLAMGLDLVAAADEYFNEKQPVAAGMFAAFAFLPLIGRYFRWGKVSAETASRLMKTFKNVKTEEEVLNVMKTLPQQDRYLVQQMMKEDPNKIVNLIKELISKKIVTKEQSIKVVNQINNLIKTNQIAKEKAVSLFKNLGLRNFGYTIGASGAIILGTMGYQKYKIKSDFEGTFKENNPENQNIDNNISISFSNLRKTDKLGYEKIVPIWIKYMNLYDNPSNENLLRKIQQSILSQYSKNPNQDFDKVAQTIVNSQTKQNN